jgi:hypothetical protein
MFITRKSQVQILPVIPTKRDRVVGTAPTPQSKLPPLIPRLRKLGVWAERRAAPGYNRRSKNSDY